MHSDSNGVKRIGMYIKAGLKFEVIKKEELPCILIRLSHMDILYLYSQFRENSYTVESQLLKEKQKTNILIDVLDWFAGICKRCSMVIGDINCDWLRESKPKRRMLTWANDAEFKQLIKVPTRFGPNGEKSCLDLCFSRSNCKVVANVMDAVIPSDHIGIMVHISKEKNKFTPVMMSKVKFTMDMVLQLRQRPHIFDDAEYFDTLVDRFTDWIKEVNDGAYSSKILRNSGNKWYSDELRKLKNRYLECEIKEIKTNLRNSYVCELRRVKRKFIREEINKNKKRGIWSLINRQRKCPITELSSISGPLTNPRDIAQEFREHFSRKVENLAKTASPERIYDLMRDKFHDAEPWDIFDCKEEEVAKIIDQLKPKKSRDPDGLSYLTLKTFKFEILSSLTKLTNLIISKGLFPTRWKLSKVTPIYKKGSKGDPDNYRPIGQSSVLGIVVEKVIKNQISPNIDKILPDQQFGFRVKRSTSDALTCLLDNIKDQKARKKKVALLALDAKAAFDTIDRGIIMESFKIIGAGPNFNRWIKNFFLNRRSYVDIGGTRSSEWSSSVGVPQGGVTSPDFYNVGAMSQSFWSEKTNSIVFADDGIEIIGADSVEELKQKVQRTAIRMADWFDSIGLTLHVGKTEIMGIGSQLDPIDLRGTNIEPVEVIKFLGVHIDKNLKNDVHVQYVCKKLRSVAGRIRAEGRNVSQSERRILFNAWARGYLQSNALAYLPHLKEGQIDMIQVAWNAGIRAVFGLKRRGPAKLNELRKQFKIPSIRQLCKIILMMEAWNSKPSQYKMDYGPITRSRASGNVITPNLQGWNGKTTKSKVILAWNHIPSALKSDVRFNIVKRKVRDTVLDSVNL